jgi:hypothetical protein
MYPGLGPQSLGLETKLGLEPSLGKKANHRNKSWPGYPIAPI